MTGMGCLFSTFLFLFLAVVPRYSLAATFTNASGHGVVSSGLVREFGAVTPEMIDQLRTELWLRVPTAQQENAAMLLLSPLEVISARKQRPNIAILAGIKMARIQRLTLGTAPEFVEVGRNYALFYEGVVRGVWGVVLKQRLRRADDALKKLTRQTLARKIYLDEFEKELGKNQESVLGRGGESRIPGLEKSRIESYLDDAEKRFDKP